MADRTWLEPPRGPACGEDVAGATGSARVWLARAKSCTLARGGLVLVGACGSGAKVRRRGLEDRAGDEAKGRAIVDRYGFIWISRIPRATARDGRPAPPGPAPAPARAARPRPPRGPAHEMYAFSQKRLCMPKL